MDPKTRRDTELEQALSEISLWPITGELDAAPVAIKGGLTNKSYLLSIDQQRYRLRINSAIAGSLGINRAREAHIVKRVHAAGLSPALLFSGYNHRYSLFEFVEGRVWSANDLQKKQQRKKLEACIAQFQQLSIEGTPRNYQAYLDQYWQQLCGSNKLSDTEREKYLAFAATLEKQADTWPEFVLCHHDLIPENIIETENGISIIDWEYAALGHPELDAYCVNSSLVDPSSAPSEDDALLNQLVFWLNHLWTLVSDQLAC